ncbi:MAG: GNAT family N-acetyltransferase [Alphaproteobacteria bacterium]
MNHATHRTPDLPEGTRFDVIDDPTPGERAVIDKGLQAHAARLSVPLQREPLAIMLRDEDGDILAGLLAHWYAAHGACIIQDLWVHEELRGRGIGHGLMMRLENELLMRGCRLIHLDLMDFQARDFFQDLGFEIVGSVAYPTSGRARLFLAKELTATG